MLHRNGGLIKGRDEMANRFVQSDLAFFDEREHRGAGDGLCLRSDAKDRRRVHASAGFLISPTDSALIHRLFFPAHKRAGSPPARVFSVALEQMINAG